MEKSPLVVSCNALIKHVLIKINSKDKVYDLKAATSCISSLCNIVRSAGGSLELFLTLKYGYKYTAYSYSCYCGYILLRYKHSVQYLSSLSILSNTLYCSAWSKSQVQNQNRTLNSLWSHPPPTYRKLFAGF